MPTTPPARHEFLDAPEALYLGAELQTTRWRDTVEVLDRLRAGRVRLTRFRLPPRAFPEAFLAQFSGGPRHRALCALGSVLLESRGLCWSARTRHYGPGGTLRCDLWAEQGNVVVECGSGTNKVRAALDEGRALVALPYPDSDRETLRSQERGQLALWFEPAGVLDPGPEPLEAACSGCGQLVRWYASRCERACETPARTCWTFDDEGLAYWLPVQHRAACGLPCAAVGLRWLEQRPGAAWHHPRWCPRDGSAASTPTP